MSMNKVMHCAIRRDLRRFNEALAGFPDGDRRRASDLHRAWENFDAQLTHHHEGEHEIAWPALRSLGVEESLIGQLDDEHDRMAAALAEARSAMDRFGTSASRADADLAAEAMGRLQLATVTHLDHEEAQLEPVFAEHAGSQALKDMSTKFGRSQPMGAAGVYMAWLQDGAAQEESAALRSSIPGPVVTVLSKVFGRRYHREVAPVWSSPPR